MEYKVTWEIDCEAASPMGAASYALAVMQDCDSLATVFTVENMNGNLFEVDVHEETVIQL